MIDNRHKCKHCLKFINEKVFLDKNGLCFKCFYENNSDKNLRKKIDKKKTKNKKKQRDYKQSNLLIE
jgi:hypothetical protein|tara:strand:+ start:2710 stop:2910 length:201 start_codon:yes stop_codon:yes gene_type:complete